MPSISPCLKVLAFGWWFPPHCAPIDFRGVRTTPERGGVRLYAEGRELHILEMGEVTASQEANRRRGHLARLPDRTIKLLTSSITNPFRKPDGEFVETLCDEGRKADAIVMGHCMGAGISRVSALPDALRDRTIVTSWDLLPPEASMHYRQLGIRHIRRARLLAYLFSLEAPALELTFSPVSASSASAEL